MPMFDFREALRVDFSRPVRARERLQKKKLVLAARNGEGGDGGGDDAAGDAGADANNDSEGWAENVEVGDSASPPDPESSNEDTACLEGLSLRDLKIQFIIELCRVQTACGQCTVDAEERASAVAASLGLGLPALEIGPRHMFAAFDPMGGGARFLTASRDIVLCRLMDVTDLAIIVALEGESYERRDVEAALLVLRDIAESPLPYGWLMSDILVVVLTTLSTVGSFFGSYEDMLVVFVISLVLQAVHKVVNRFPDELKPLELLLICAFDGLLTAAAWRIMEGYGLAMDAMCNIPIILFSPIFMYFPGSELVYGAYEVIQGHPIVGASRLVAALVRCMVMASGLTIGWQFTGYNLYAEVMNYGDIAASLVPTDRCYPFREEHNVGPWWVVFALINLVYLIPIQAVFHTRPGDMIVQCSISYVSLLFFGAMEFAGPDGSGLGLPHLVINILGLFVATNLACLKEYITMIPAVTSIVPVIMYLAPGSTVVLELLKLIQADQNVPGVGNEEVTSQLWFLGVSYALGMHIALALWKHILSKRQISTLNMSMMREHRMKQVPSFKM